MNSTVLMLFYTVLEPYEKGGIARFCGVLEVSVLVGHAVMDGSNLLQQNQSETTQPEGQVHDPIPIWYRTGPF